MIACSRAISRCEKHGDWGKARPFHACFAVLCCLLAFLPCLGSCEALQIFCHLRQRGLERDLPLLNTLTRAQGRGDRWRNALDVFEDFESATLEKDLTNGYIYT